jgi:branched-subunit amino acid transport protein
MIVWLAIICAGILTFSARFLTLSPLMPKTLPVSLQLALKFVPVSVLMAIIVPAIFISPETGTLVIQDNLRIGAAIIAIIVAYYTRSTVATIISGLCVIWLLTFWQ